MPVDNKALHNILHIQTLWQNMHRQRLDSTVCVTDLEVQINSISLQLSLLLTCRAAILDFEVGEVLLIFRVGNPTPAGVPVEISDRVVGTSNFSVQTHQKTLSSCIMGNIRFSMFQTWPTL